MKNIYPIFCEKIYPTLKSLLITSMLSLLITSMLSLLITSMLSLLITSMLSLGRAPEVRGEARAGGRPLYTLPNGSPRCERPPARASPRASGARPKESMLVMSKESMLVMSKESMLVMSKDFKVG